MAISLVKGQNVALDKGLKNVLVGLGWDVPDSQGNDYDIDASCFMLGENGRVRSDSDFIFYNQLKSPCGSVAHSGDNRTGAGDGDDESLIVKLDKVPADVQKLVFIVTIHEAVARRQNFGQVQNAFIRIVNQDNNNEEGRFDLNEDASTSTSTVFGEIYRKDSQWKFKAVGAGYNKSIMELAQGYGVNVG